MVGKVIEEIVARGHPNVSATHRTTFEITKDRELSKRGDCIIGIRAEKSISEVSDSIKNRLRGGRPTKITLLLPDYGLKEEIRGMGSNKMTFDHPTDIVVRRSSFVCGRTLLIKADRAAIDLSREMVEVLRDPSTLLVFRIEIQ
jgi:hypothetical protein